MIGRLNPDTLSTIETVVDEKMRNQECFFALDVTNEVKQRGYKTTPPSNFGSHKEMAPHVADHARALAAHYDYSWSLLDVGNGSEQAWLYFPSGASTATIQSHVNRRVTPLIPVEVWAQQVSQQGSGVQSQITAPQLADALQQAPQGVVVQTSLKQFGQHVLRLIRGSN